MYATDGTTDDHAYGICGVASYCIEMGTAFFQACTTFENTIYPTNLQALIYAAKVVRTPYQTPLARTRSAWRSAPARWRRATPVTLTATINDTRYRTRPTAPSRRRLSPRPSTTSTPRPGRPGAVANAMTASDGSFSSTIEGVTASVSTAGLSTGKHILFVRGKDANSNWGAFSAIFLTVTEPVATSTPTATPTITSTPTETLIPTETPTPTQTPMRRR